MNSLSEFSFTRDINFSKTSNPASIFFRRFSQTLFLILLGLFWIGMPMWAQSPASLIEGVVKDPSGAVVRGAQVHCFDALGDDVSRVTDREGKFQFAVSPGTAYQVVITQPGFSAGVIHVDPLKPGGKRTLDISLQISARTDSVVVSASMVDQPIAQVGSSVTVITRDELRSTDTALVKEALENVPGLDVTAAGRLGGTTSIFARGGNSNYDLVLLDGIKLNDFGGGLGFDFSNLVADNVERIEVVRGPQSALYGSEAIGATINIVTPRGDSAPRFFFQGEGGSYDLNRFASGANGLTRQIGWAVNVSRLASQGANFNDDYWDQNASGRVDFEGLTHTRAGIHFNSNANDAGSPGAYGRDPNQTFFGLDLTSRTKNNDYVTGTYLEHEFSPRFRERVEANWLSRNFRFISPTQGDSFSDNFRGVLRSESDAALTTNDALAFGFEYQRERFFNNFVTDPTGNTFALRRNNFAYFGENRWNWRQRLFVTAGVRIENFRTDSILPVPFSHTQSFPAASVVSTNPRISAAYFVRASSHGLFNYAKWHGSFGTGIRMPNGFELAFTSNPKLQPERTRSMDAGVETAWWNGRALVDATYFYNHFEDQIVTLTGDLRRLSTFTSDNLGNARAQGLELTLSLRPTDKLRVAGEYTFLKSEILSLSGAPGSTGSVFTVGDPLIRRPTHSGSFTVAWTEQRWAMTFQTLLHGSSLDIDPNLGTFACSLGLPCFFKNPGYVDANVTTSYELADGVSWYARINNLLNQRYEEVLGYPAYRLNFVSGIRLDLGGERGWHLRK